MNDFYYKWIFIGKILVAAGLVLLIIGLYFLFDASDNLKPLKTMDLEVTGEEIMHKHA